MVGTVSYSTFAGVRTRHFCHCPVFSVNKPYSSDDFMFGKLLTQVC